MLRRPLIPRSARPGPRAEDRLPALADCGASRGSALGKDRIVPKRVLITLDAVGGVWRYAVDVARGLEALGVTCLLAGFGPEPDAAQLAECEGLRLEWTRRPLDWTVANDTELGGNAERLAALARAWDADVLHLNLPSQAAGLPEDGRPVLVVSHSCVPTWWRAVRGSELPPDWAWHQRLNLMGLRRADAIAAPSASHAAALRGVYGKLPPIRVIHNATAAGAMDTAEVGGEPFAANAPGITKQDIILSVGRWWDAGKNGEALDRAATSVPWPVALAGPTNGPNDQRIGFRNAEILGPMPHADILALMRRAAIFAAPSRYEPFGLAVAEAAVCGAALVLSDIPTFRELWDGAALFVPPDDVASWAEALAGLASDPVLRRRLSAEARRRAGRFTPERQAAALCDLYSSMTKAAVPA